MGHGACMGIAWMNMKDGWMGLKHSSPNITYFLWDMYVWGVWAAQASKCTPGHPPKLDMFEWGGRF